MRHLLDKLYKGSCWLAASCIAAIALLVVCQVFLNLLDKLSILFTGTAIGLTIPSYADFTGFLLAAASFFSLAYTLKEGGHIRVTLVIGRLPAKIRRIVELWCVAVAGGITVYFSWYTLVLTWESYRYHDLSPGMIAVPIWIPQSAMLLGLLVLSLALVEELFSILTGREPGYSGKGENLLADDEPDSIVQIEKG
ncbi:TRAP transporter small permease [Desulfomarina sp.]